MYIKCFIATKGNFNAKTIVAPISQTNLSTGIKGYRGFVADIKSRYFQALRHNWGALDGGYAVRQTYKLWQERHRIRATSQPLHLQYSDNLNTDIVQKAKVYSSDVENTGFSASATDYETTTLTIPSTRWFPFLVLFYRLFEAQCLPVHMLIIIVSTSAFTLFTITGTSPHVIMILDISSKLRLAGLACFMGMMLTYEFYHRACLAERVRELRELGLYEVHKDNIGQRSWRRNWIDYLMVPVVGVVYGSLPALHAQLKQLRSPKLVYRVTPKPVKPLDDSV